MYQAALHMMMQRLSCGMDSILYANSQGELQKLRYTMTTIKKQSTYAYTNLANSHPFYDILLEMSIQHFNNLFLFVIKFFF